MIWIAVPVDSCDLPDGNVFSRKNIDKNFFLCPQIQPPGSDNPDDTLYEDWKNKNPDKEDPNLPTWVKSFWKILSCHFCKHKCMALA